MKHLTLFETTAAYNAATLNLPNVSLIKENMSVAYNPYVAPETRVVAKYNVTDTSNPTTLRTNYEENIFKAMEIDGIMLNELVTEYTFDTTGIHTVKYELYDETKLGNQAPVFYSNNLIECIIPDSVTSIGDYAFLSCISLTSIDIPDSVTNIGQSAFFNCTGLTSITIPNSVTSIGSKAFDNTDALKVLNYNAKYELNSSFRCAWVNLETVIIGNSTPSIGDSALSSCTSLTSITIGNSVTSIGNSAFYSCSGLTSVTIPDSVTSIGSSAFSGCTGLTSIISNATTAPTIQNTTFLNIHTDGTLTVPTGSTGYNTWMGTDNYYLGKYNWTKIEQ